MSAVSAPTQGALLRGSRQTTTEELPKRGTATGGDLGLQPRLPASRTCQSPPAEGPRAVRAELAMPPAPSHDQL